MMIVSLHTKTLNSTILQELNDAEFGVWCKFLMLAAAYDPIHGRFKIADIDIFAQQIHSTPEVIEETLKKCGIVKRLKTKEISEGLQISICNWLKYQLYARKLADIQKQKKGEKRIAVFDKERKGEERKEKGGEEGGNPPISPSLTSLKNSEEKKDAPAIISEQYLKLASLFAEEWKEAHPDLRTSPSQKMTDAEVFRSMIEEDRIDLVLIENVIKSWRHNQFWRSALIGAEHFRKKFQQLIQARDEDLKKGLLGIDEYVKWALNDEAEFSRVCDKKPKDRNAAEEELLEEFERKHPGR